MVYYQDIHLNKTKIQMLTWNLPEVKEQYLQQKRALILLLKDQTLSIYLTKMIKIYLKQLNCKIDMKNKIDISGWKSKNFFVLK